MYNQKLLRTSEMTQTNRNVIELMSLKEYLTFDKKCAGNFHGWLNMSKWNSIAVNVVQLHYCHNVHGLVIFTCGYFSVETTIENWIVIRWTYLRNKL